MGAYLSAFMKFTPDYRYLKSLRPRYKGRFDAIHEFSPLLTISDKYEKIDWKDFEIARFSIIFV